jgi:hypothetical protein
MIIQSKTFELEPQVKLKNSFAVFFREGIFVDHNQLMINNEPVFDFTASMLALSNSIDFVFHDKPYQFRFSYSRWTGKPRSFVVLQNNQVIAKYGDDTALKLKS